MRVGIAAVVVFFSVNASAQESTFYEPMFEHMVGNWVLKGAIAGGEVTHDIEVKWVLAHQYVQLYELSREKDSTGNAAYEAIVYFGQDKEPNQYVCLWLDVTGGSGLSSGVLGHATIKGNELPFHFKDADGTAIHTTFTYDKDSDTWRWRIDTERNGTMRNFAQLKQERKK